MSKHIHIWIGDRKEKARDADTAYKGYVIRSNPITGDWFIIKGGHTLSHPNDLTDAKKKIDELVALGLNTKDAMEFEFGIKNASGKYYNGKTTPAEIWGLKNQAFTYSEAGARRKIDNTPAFKGCSVERVL